MMEVIKAVEFKHCADVVELINDFKQMVNFCIDKAIELRITSYAKLRKAIYNEWKEKWYPKYHTHYCHSACRVATSILKNFRKRKRKGLTRKDKPEVKKDFIKLEEMLFKFEEDRIKIITAPRKFISINLVVSDYQRKFIEEWKNERLKVGEVIVKKDSIIIPFKKVINPKNFRNIMTIDVNEKNITYSIFDKDGNIVKTIRLDVYMLKRIHENFSKKREKIQKKLANKPMKLKTLMKKYSGREKRKVEDYLHKISKFLVSEALKHNAKIVMEDLTNIRNAVNKKSKNLRRRLNRWNFSKLQFFIEYKAKWGSLDVEYVNPSRTSKLCPICGCKLDPNGQRLLKCNNCNLVFDRDVVATFNLFKKSQNVGSFRSPRTLPDEVWLIKPDGTGEPLREIT
jgi:putative transposase